MRAYRTLICAALAWASFSVPARASPEESALGQKLTSEARDFLSALLGPGKSKVSVMVSGQTRQTQSSTSILSPLNGPSEEVKIQKSFLPGYADQLITGQNSRTARQKESASAPDFEQSQKSEDMSLSFVVTKIQVSVILDKNLRESQIKEVSKALPALLGLNKARGDTITVLRANLIQPWKTTFNDFARSRQALGIAALALGALILLLIAAFALYVTATSVTRTFVSELAALRTSRGAEALGQSASSGGGLESRGGTPEILPGGIPSLSDPQSAGDFESGGVPVLGRRFDFLAAQDPEEIAPLLAQESAGDIALLFGALANTHPDLAVSLFSALPPRTQREASQALLNLTMADPERLSLLENKIRNMVEFGLRGPERLGKILSRLPGSERETILGDITPQNPEAAQELERSLFAFEDFSRLKDADLRRVIGAMNLQDLGAALRGAPRELIERMMGQIPLETRVMVKDSMETPQPRAKVMEIRSRMLAQVQEMAKRGEISLGSTGASSEMM